MKKNKASHQKYKALMDISISAIFLTRPTGEIVEVNNAAEKMFGYTEAELIKIGEKGIFDHSAKAIHVKMAERKEKGKAQGELIGIRKNGEKFQVEFTSTVFTDLNKEEFIYTLINDISERKKSEQEMSSMINNTDESFILLNKELIIVNFNRQFQQLFKTYLGADVEKGNHLLNYAQPERKKLSTAILKRVLAGAVETSEISFPVSHGMNKHFRSKYSPSRDDNNNVIGVFLTIRDITDEKQSQIEIANRQQLIEQAEANYREIFEKASDGIFIHELETGRLLDVNQKACEIMGSSRETLLQADPENYMAGTPGYTFDVVMEKLSQAAAGNPQLFEWISRQEDGALNWVEVSLKKASIAGNERILAFFRLINDRKNEELQKNLLNEISQIFNSTKNLIDTLHKVLQHVSSFGDFCFAEAWLINADHKMINRVSSYAETEDMKLLLAATENIKGFKIGEGNAGMAWKSKEIHFWGEPNSQKDSVRNKTAKENGLVTGISIPMLNNNQVIGVLLFGLEKDESDRTNLIGLFNNLGSYLGPEVIRKQLEQELNQFFNFAPDIILITGIDGYIKKINPAACDLLEYTEGELMAMPFMNFVHPDDKDKTVLELKNISKGKPTFYFENRYITKSGKVKWLAWTSTSSEEVIFAVAKNITEKKELEDLLHKATNLARIGSWELDLIKKTLYWSEITREIHEAEPDYTPLLETATYFYKEGKYRDEINIKIKDAIEKGKKWDGEFQIITAKGNERWIRTIGEPEIVNGKCVRVYGSFQDIDERKKAEENIRNSEERQKLIMNSALDAIIFIDKNGTVTFWNPQAEQIFGWKENEVMGKLLSSLIIPEAYRIRHEEGMKKYLKTGEGPVLNVLLQLSAIKRSGEEFPIELTILPIQQDGEEFFCAFIRDITERKHSETRLIELNDSLRMQTQDLAASNQELEQFAYVASHDLQEPLRMISSFLNQLERKYGNVIDDKGKKYIYYAIDGAKRMRQIILDLLEFSRVGRMDSKHESVDLNEVIEELKILFRKEIRDKKASVHVDPLPIVQIYKTPIRQVFQNLISNALKYSRKGIPLQIQINAFEFKTHWQFAVADNGIGIDKEYFDKIFIIFQRLHNKDEYSGTGMGLAVTKKIVETWGGKIDVESNLDKGTTFYFTIPINKFH